MAQDEDACEAVARWNRSALSPGMARRIFSMVFRFDVRSLLPSVGCPTLVLYPTRALSTILSHGQYLADHIPNAHMEVFDTADVLPYQQDHNVWMTGEIQEFLTGDRPSPPADDRVLATVLFTDIVGSTNRAAALGDKAWAELLARHEEIGRSMVERYRGRFINTTGDGLLATFEGPARAIRCAREMRAAIGKLGLDIRAGAHTGEIEPSGKDVSGMAVHIGARISAMAGPGEVLVSSTVKDLVVGSGIEFEDRGTHQLKGVPDEWHVFAVRE
jgi:class 3 adenylate cyclase